MNNAGEAAKGSVPAKFGPRRPEELLHGRVRRFTKLLHEVLNDDRAEAVHDLRVCSLRLQQVLVLMYPKGRVNRADSLIGILRRTRRILSRWRDCDVLMALIDRKSGRLHNPDEQRAWRTVYDYVAGKREEGRRTARHKLAKRELFTLPQEIERILKDSGLNVGSDDGVAYDLIKSVGPFIEPAYSDWQAIRSRMAESGPGNLHDFRIKTRKLRYRIEVARELGDQKLLLSLNWLKLLQTRLGQLHDRSELTRIAMKALVQTDFSLTAPCASGLLMRKLARELVSETAKLQLLLTELNDASELVQLENWVVSHRERQT